MKWQMLSKTNNVERNVKFIYAFIGLYIDHMLYG